MSKFWKSLILTTLILIWSATYYVEVSNLSWKNNSLIKPVFWVMVVLYFINLTIDYMENKKEIKNKEKNNQISNIAVVEKGKNISFDSTAIRISLVFICIFLYVIIVQLIGYIISTYLLLIGLMIVMGVSHWKLIIFFPAIFVAMLYAIFKLGLNIPLPVGIFGL